MTSKNTINMVAQSAICEIFMEANLKKHVEWTCYSGQIL